MHANACAGAHTAYRQRRQLVQAGEGVGAGRAEHKDDRACALASCMPTSAHMIKHASSTIGHCSTFRTMAILYCMYAAVQSDVLESQIINICMPKCMISNYPVEMAEYPIHIRVRARRHGI